jgi:hypothetical protein
MGALISLGIRGVEFEAIHGNPAYHNMVILSYIIFITYFFRYLKNSDVHDYPFKHKEIQ